MKHGRNEILGVMVPGVGPCDVEYETAGRRWGDPGDSTSVVAVRDCLDFNRLAELDAETVAQLERQAAREAAYDRKH